MAVLIIGDVPGQTREGYEGMIAALGSAMKEAPGFVMHTAYPVEDGWRVVEVWASARDAGQFFATFVHPNLPPGIQPKRSVQELHTLVSV